jgi:hypothetical protein
VYGGQDAIGAPLSPFGMSPIADSTTGALLGYASPPNQVVFLRGEPNRQLLREFVDADVAAGFLLRTVDISTSRRQAVVSYSEGFGARAFRHIHWQRNGNLRATRLLRCPRPATRPFVEGSVHFEQFGRSDWPLAAFTIRTTGTRRGLVIFLPGGPLSPVFNAAYLTRWQNYSQIGYDVLVPIASGRSELGPQAIRRLAESPSYAIETDARLLTEQLRDRFAEYGTIVIHAESFGASFALALARHLRPQQPVIVLVSPWLAYKSPASWAPTPSYQHQFEAHALGFPTNQNAYFDWIGQLAANELPGRRALVLFGARDTRVDLTIGPSLQRMYGARLHTIAGADHDTAMVSPQSWQLISDFIGEP